MWVWLSLSLCLSHLVEFLPAGSWGKAARVSRLLEQTPLCECSAQLMPALFPGKVGLKLGGTVPCATSEGGG